MKKKLATLSVQTLGIFLMIFGFTKLEAAPWINEFHYDTAGTDTNEFVEVFVTVDYVDPVSTIAVTLYNGGNGASYGNHTLDTFTVGDVIPGVGTFFSKLISGIQNGDPDGIALSTNGVLVQFLSYEGTFAGTDGVANGVNSVDIGVREDNTAPVDSSLGLTGIGAQFSDFTWVTNISSATRGQINPGQTINAPIINTNTSTNSVTIATTANASELGTNGVFTLTSTGTNFPITVTYTVSGTATLTNDYDFLAPATSNSVVMTSSPTTIEIVPVNDGDTNEIDPESVILTLDASGTGWTSGIPNSAQVDIFAEAVIPPVTNGGDTNVANLEGFSIILKKPKPGKTRKFKSAKGFPVKLFVVTASNTVSSVAYAAVVAGNTNNTNNTNAITFITAGKIKPITKGKKFKQNIKAMAKSTKTTKAGVNIPVGTTSIEFIVRVDGTAGTNTGSAFFTNTIPTIVK